ncbi:hypothetical protein DCO46_17730 [Flavobacterium sp. HTF]|nr:hypothetical protein DCO46_17730 [Flavobacterium sp. HTF]
MIQIFFYILKLYISTETLDFDSVCSCSFVLKFVNAKTLVKATINICNVFVFCIIFIYYVFIFFLLNQFLATET